MESFPLIYFLSFILFFFICWHVCPIVKALVLDFDELTCVDFICWACMITALIQWNWETFSAMGILCLPAWWIFLFSFHFKYAFVCHVATQIDLNLWSALELNLALKFGFKALISISTLQMNEFYYYHFCVLWEFDNRSFCVTKILLYALSLNWNLDLWGNDLV